MLTGFRSLQVMLVTIMVTVITGSFFVGHFSALDDFRFRALAWYWHFVDVVGLLLFVIVYWL